jgi:hypothetical protein
MRHLQDDAALIPSYHAHSGIDADACVSVISDIVFRTSRLIEVDRRAFARQSDQSLARV